jgi:hypothetical protein
MNIIEKLIRVIFTTQVENNDITDYNTMDLDEDNLIDLNERSEQLIGIVHEQEGGIIAYAIGQEHADEIQKALTLYKELNKIN